jgi:hypothetical protein
MFERVVFLLLSGEFICKVSHPEAFRFLSNDNEFLEVDNYLSKLGRRLARTSHESGFYLAFSHCGESERKIIVDHYQKIKGVLMPVVLFFQLVMRATGKEDILMHGSMIETNFLIGQIDQDPGLRNELQSLAVISKSFAADGSHRIMFDKIIRLMKDEGYLVLANPDRGLYQVTSKVEYLLDVVRFLQDNDEKLKAEEDTIETEGKTETLL